MEFWADFSAEDAARLPPCKDDKPKYAEFTPIKADSDSKYQVLKKIFFSVLFDINIFMCYILM